EKTLTRPELSILMAYSKMQLYQALLESDLPGHQALAGYLEAYFPERLRADYRGRLAEHPLAREITATVLTNEIVDQAGSVFLNRLVQRTGVPLARAAEAYLIFDQVLDAGKLRRAIWAGDNRLDAARQHQLLLDLEGTIGSLCEWALDRGLDVALDGEVVEHYRDRVEHYRKAWSGLYSDADWEAVKERMTQLQEEGFSEDEARTLATLDRFEDFLPLLELVEHTDSDFYSVARTYSEVRRVLDLQSVLRGMAEVPLRDRWDRMAQQAVVSAFIQGAFRLTAAVFAEADGNPESFLGRRRPQNRAYQGLRDRLRGTVPTNFHPYTVLARALESLAETHS
ncbi:MAG TPA: hypothetical protein VKA48_04295, partial [Gammaproteobacteria bacterium]|nr:hypothetical protein [Gammaproteobacteria bacterium]